MVQKGSTPWSTRTVAEGGTDSPVGDLIPVPDSAQPVINAGFIDESGKWRLAAASNDSTFTFQDPDQAIAAGAKSIIDGINMLNHDMLIIAVKDSSGNNIIFSLHYNNDLVGATGPYTAPIFTDDGVNTGNAWHVNEYPGFSGSAGVWDEILNTDANENASTAWQFYKVIGLRGTLGQVYLLNGEGSDAGTISTAYLRLV